MKLMIGLGSCGIASGGLKIKEMFSAMARENPGINLVISETGCMGMCYMEPMVELIDDEGQGTVYGCVSPEMAKEIFEKHILGGARSRTGLL